MEPDIDSKEIKKGFATKGVFPHKWAFTLLFPLRSIVFIFMRNMEAKEISQSIFERIMKNLTFAETIIALEKTALESWHNGNPSPFLDLYSKDYTYFDPAQERRLDGWDKIKTLYESIRGKVEMDKFEMINPVVQRSDKVAVLTYNLHSFKGDKIWKENCTEVYRLEENNEWKIIHSHWSMTKPPMDNP